jgi:DNA repair protein RadC
MQAKRVHIVRIKLVRESSLLYATRRLNAPANAAELLRQVLDGADREPFVAVSLNAKNEPNALEVVSTGTLNSALVHPREIFQATILANAHAVVLGHNHPSGDLEPSKEDREATHTQSCSMFRMGRFPALRGRPRYRTAYRTENGLPNPSR